jgi:hypothetical protein
MLIYTYSDYVILIQLGTFKIHDGRNVCIYYYCFVVSVAANLTKYSPLPSPAEVCLEQEQHRRVGEIAARARGSLLLCSVE